MSRPFTPTPYVPDPTLHPIAVQVPFLKLGKSRFENGVDVTPSRCALASLTFQLPMSSLEAQRSLFMAGACPMVYDGTRAHEAGFHSFPEGIRAVGVTTGSGALTNATYGVAFAFEWEDAKGVLHRSDLSVPLSVPLGANNALSCRVPFLRLTDKQDRYDNTDKRRGAVRIIGYRTVASGTIYYRDNPTVGSGLENNIAGLDDATIIFETSDADLVKNEIAYPTGRPSAVGGLGFGNDAFPSSSIACLHQRRIFQVCQEEQSFLQYTDEIDERFLAPATNEIYRIPIPVEGGSVVGLASMDEKLVIFCQRRIYFVFGEGPNQLGQQNGYSVPQLCSATLGAAGGYHSSIVLTPEGLWFLSSSNALRLLSRGLVIAEQPPGPDGAGSYVGSDVDESIPSGLSRMEVCAIDSRNQLRWYLSDQTVLVWDYMQKRWTRFTGHNSSGGALSARGKFFHSDGTHLYASEASPGTTGDDVPAMVLESAWIDLAGRQGFQRVYSLMLLARSMHQCRIQVEEGFNYQSSYISRAVRSQILGTPCVVLGYVGGGGVIPPTLTDSTSGATATVLCTTAGLQPGNAAPAGGAFVVTFTPSAGAFLPGNVLAGGLGTITDATDALFLPLSPLVDDTDVLAQVNGTSATISSVTVAGVVGQVVFYTITAGTGFALAQTTISSLFRYTTSAADPCQIEHRLSQQQQCESFRFRLTIDGGLGGAESLRLTNFALSIGMKRGLFKLPSAQRF